MKKLDYAKAILQVLGRAPHPMDVEKIRVACKIGNWQTALRHCLELLHEGRIEGTKTSKSWIFSPKSKATEGGQKSD